MNLKISKLLIINLLILGSSCSHLDHRNPAQVADSKVVFINKINPFTTDGCSRFFDGTPLSKTENKKWISCCIQHDISYWQGGTEEQRKAADSQLKQCVADKSNSVISEIMYLGVRVGGTPQLPATWRWGYGWVVNFGYHELSPSEKLLVQQEYEKISLTNLVDLVQSEPIMNKIKNSITSDYCIDMIAVEVQKITQDKVLIQDVQKLYVENVNNNTSLNPEIKSNLRISFKTPNCLKPLTSFFKVTSSDSCTKTASELSVDAAVKLIKIEGLESCQPLNKEAL